MAAYLGSKYCARVNSVLSSIATVDREEEEKGKSTNVWEIERKRGESREVVKLLDQARAKIRRENEFLVKEFLENYSNFLSSQLQENGVRIELDRWNNSDDVANWHCHLSSILSREKIIEILKKHIFRHITYVSRMYMAESVQLFSESILKFASTVHKETLSFDKLISEEKFQVGKKTWMKQSLPSKQLEQSSSKQESVSRSTGSWKGGGGRRRREEADKEARKKKSYGSQSSGWWNKRSIYRLVVPLIQRENVTSHLATLHIPLPGYIVHYNSSMLVT